MEAQERPINEYITPFPYFKKLFLKCNFVYVCLKYIHIEKSDYLCFTNYLNLSLDVDLFPDEH